MAAPPAHVALGLRFERLSPVAWGALACGLAALWLLGRRYGGITHDATLYLAQGLRRLDPAVLDRDPFFAHRGQDAFTLFPLLYAPLIEAFGGSTAAMLVTIAGQLAFFAAAAALAVRLGPGPARWWSLALLAVVSGFYGGVGVFRFAEPFATARTLAEPLVVISLALTLVSLHGIALAALAAAAALHPLVAAPGFLVVYLWHASRRPRLFWLIPAFAAAAVAVILAWPEARLRFDAPWRDAVMIRSPHLFIALWRSPDLARIAWGLCVAAAGLGTVGGPALRLALCALAAGCLGICATGIGVDLMDSALVASLQPWRALWLMHLACILALPFVIAGLWRFGNAGRAAAACLAASCCFGREDHPAAALLAALGVVLAASEWRRPGWMGERTLHAILVATLAVASVGLMFEVQSRLPLAYAARPVDWTDYIHAAASVGGLLPLAGLIWLGACSRWPWAGLALGFAATVTAVISWDARSQWSRYIEQAGVQESPFRQSVPRGATVFWPEPGGPAWLLLRAPSWFSVDQGAGIVFHRATAIEYTARRQASLELRAGMQNCVYVDRVGCDIKPEYAHKLCTRRDAPDYLVLNGRIEGQAAVEWRLPPGLGPGRNALYLYACRDFAA